MQIEIQIQSGCPEPKIIIVTDQMTEEINTVIRRLTEEPSRMLAGFRDDTVELLEPSRILRVYSGTGKVFAETQDGTYTLRLRLYELESRLDKSVFVRISHSEIINLRMVKQFDLSFSGTICVSLEGGTVTYVSRRYVPKIKQVLGM